ncbi:hypothetical protein GJ496_010063 [Pomphorhynchus laevis]|nr:hypothetical protein GJ496_010063 [Pomphorhynchus laevis]
MIPRWVRRKFKKCGLGKSIVAGRGIADELFYIDSRFIPEHLVKVYTLKEILESQRPLRSSSYSERLKTMRLLSLRTQRDMSDMILAWQILSNPTHALCGTFDLGNSSDLRGHKFTHRHRILIRSKTMQYPQ